ncbi:MAG TPA: DNA polymerase III subunit delta', partial [Acidobacteriota bacterium]|nr:DNA polymerase III subunit delta' [Acidobacteriota bacterium]
MATHSPIDPQAPFWQQPAVERTLRQASARGRLARAYLLEGPEGCGKWAAAHWVARHLLCRERGRGDEPCGTCQDCRRVDSGTHSDWHVLIPIPSGTAEKESEELLAARRTDPYAVFPYSKRPYIKIDRVRALISELNHTSVEGGSKVVLIAGAEEMAPNVQTILLKSIEEPPPDTHFVLTSPDPGRLFATVVSRCQVIRFLPVDPSIIAERLAAEHVVPPEKAQTIAELCGGGWGNAVRLAQEDKDTWRAENTELWHMAFRARTAELMERIETLFRPKRRNVGLGPTLEAFDLWSLLLRRECALISSAGGQETDRASRAPIPDLETAWVCW